jgi:hypothetical protein
VWFVGLGEYLGWDAYITCIMIEHTIPDAKTIFRCAE